MTNNVTQQAAVNNIRGVADIVFCIDHSGSMEHCINGVKNHIRDFIATLENMSGNVVVDWRIGLVLYTSKEIRFLNLTQDLSAIREVLSEKNKKSNEFTPGAIDFAVTNTSWRGRSHRVIVVFTDESLKEGWSNDEPDMGAGKFNELLIKLATAKIQLLYFGPYCDYYNEFNMVPKAMVNTVAHFDDVNFNELLKNIAATVSKSSTNAQMGIPVPPLVYNLKSISIKTY